MSENPPGKVSWETLVRRLQNTEPLPYQGIGYRSSSPKYATTQDLLTGEGSARFGGRWNPPGLRAVYLSLSPETAMQETLAHFRYYNIDVHAALPRTFVAIAIDLDKTLDLTDGSLRQRIRLSRQRLLEGDWRQTSPSCEPALSQPALSQVVGRASLEAGFEGLFVPSAADASGKNLLAFPQNFGPRSGLKVLNADELRP